MSTSATVRKYATALLTVTMAVVLGLLSAPMPPAAADPTPAPSGDADPDGTPTTPREKLNAAASRYVEAKAKLDASRQRQATLADQMKITDQRLADLEDETAKIVSAAYRGDRFNVTNVLMSVDQTDSPLTLLHNAATVQYMVARDDRTIRDYADAQRRREQEATDLASEIATEEAQVAELAKAKADAERALANSSPTGGYGNLPASANPAPRNSDGSWPKESCSVDDPTTSSCLTPRTLHMLQQARAAGLTRYTSCFRNASSGEHPLGRACDFSSAATTFANSRATGGDKDYGDRVAAWCVANADRLGILYCIWYGRIWMAGVGWRTYSSDGSPAAGHYNHIHVSVY